MDPRAEWLEADGLGGFASGTVSGIRTRRYHALLLAARTPPTGRVVLVNGLDAWLDLEGASFALTSQAYAPDAVHPDGASRLEGFRPEPWPRWLFRLPGGACVEQELCVPRGRAQVALLWRLRGVGRRRPAAGLRVRLLLSGRDYHALHRENPTFRFEPEAREGRLVFRPYAGIPAVIVRAGGRYRHEPVWYRSFRYDAERARGLDFLEDLASPGVLELDLAEGPGVLLLAAEGHDADWGGEGEDVRELAERLRAEERARRVALGSPLARAAEAYRVRRGEGETLVAGYPWFTDWGRDTFIALRGLCLATGELDAARRILLEWSGAVSDGMLPNRFPDAGKTPEYNAVDASLWYVVVVRELFAELERAGRRLAAAERARLQGACDAILDGYAKGARYGIRLHADGLLAAGEPGVQLTWMDAKVGERVVTPRVGKPVEVQALWANALAAASEWSERWRDPAERARRAFGERFWSPRHGYLYDVVDVDRLVGGFDASLRPNQIFAVGGLPLALLEGERARRVVDVVERRLWTPLGLRTLAAGEPGYAPRYAGGVAERDGAYHQGTAWPWLLGPFAEAWVRVRGGSRAARRAARRRFLAPLRAHLREAGLGHVSEVADGDPPHAPGGCPFQAWSLGELLRLERRVLAEPGADGGLRGAGAR